MSMKLKKYLSEVTNKSENGNHKEALALCDAALEDFPSSYEIYETRSEVFYRMGDYEKAFSDLEHLIRIMPYEIAPLFRMGRWKLKCGDYKAAIDNLSKVIESDSDYFIESAYYFRAEALLYCHEYKKALLDCEYIPDDFFIGSNKMSKSELVNQATRGLTCNS